MSQDATGGAVVTTAFLPDLFQIEPVIPPERVRFISMPPRWWVDREAAKLDVAFGPDAREVAQAALAAAYLDRRTSLPIVNDLRFQLRLLRSLRASALTLKPAENRWSHQGIAFQGMEACGLEEPVAVDASHDEIAALLKAEVRKFFEEVVKEDGKDRERQGRGVLPGARKAPEQLRLDFDFAVVA
ncbi:MAG: hypothetical protein U0166_00560 [Acidobacteriota bacterium]